MSELLVLSAADVHALLSFADCADAMRDVLVALARGEAQQPLRIVIRPDGAAGLVALMPSYQAAAAGPPGAAYGLKAIGITPANPAAGLDTHQGIVLLSAGDTGEPLAILNASAVTEIRTAAVSVIATDALARQDADVLAVIGTGVQARAHILALDGARDLTEIRIAGTGSGKAARLAASLASQTRVPLTAADDVRTALRGAGIVVTATSSAEPVLRRDWLAPGTHVNAVGACLPHARELDTATMAAAAVYADRRDGLLSEAGDYLLAAADGAITPDQVRGELGEVLADLAPGRADDQEITVFESLGLAVEDLAAAAAAYRTAMDRRRAGASAGTWLPF